MHKNDCSIHTQVSPALLHKPSNDTLKFNVCACLRAFMCVCVWRGNGGGGGLFITCTGIRGED